MKSRKKHAALGERGLILEPDGRITFGRLPGNFRSQQYEALLERVLSGIVIIKARGDKVSLCRVRSALERKGIRRGPKQKDYSAWKIETLKNLALGAEFKNAVTNPARKRALESAQQEIWRYCLNFYRWCELANLHTPDEWQKPRAAIVFLEQFGLKFPDDLDAASEAYKRGRQTFKEHLSTLGHL